MFFGAISTGKKENTMTQQAGPLKRFEGNPILTPEQMPFRCYTVFNAGATMFQDKVLLMLRAERCDLHSAFYVATSEDGVHFSVNSQAIDYPLRDMELVYGKAHKNNRFDPRITRIDDTYYIYHFTWTDFGSSVALCWTKDFEHYDSQPHLSVPSNRNVVLFPEKIGGLYARLERPQDIDGTGAIWVSFSPDLKFWGMSRPVAMPRHHWGRHKIGSGTVPIRTPHGWLIIYHGTSLTASTENYYLAAALLDLNDPSQVVASPEEFILAPEKDYECVGQVPNVVFTSGAVEMPDGTLNVYYGGADTRVCLATGSVSELTEYCLSAQRP
ncbi:MAG: glycosidase [Chitinivibrionales bacterium]|nr:glycosidase [Chitinivibrionales bacterium]MBD3396653.1 glycosidase [Chitinivibrionales bacterium]